MGELEQSMLNSYPVSDIKWFIIIYFIKEQGGKRQDALKILANLDQQKESAIDLVMNVLKDKQMSESTASKDKAAFEPTKQWVVYK